MASVSARKTIGFDVDDTLVMTRSSVIANAKSLFGIEPSMGLLRRIGILNAFPELTSGQVKQLLRMSWENPEKLSLIDPNTQVIFDRIRDEYGFDRAIVSASFGDVDKIKWMLKRNGIKYETFFHVENSDDKAEVPVDVLVDDSFRTGMVFGKLQKPYLWMEWDVDPAVRLRLLAYDTTFPIERISQIPDMLAKNEPLRQLLRI